MREQQPPQQVEPPRQEPVSKDSEAAATKRRETYSDEDNPLICRGVD